MQSCRLVACFGEVCYISCERYCILAYFSDMCPIFLASLFDPTISPTFQEKCASLQFQHLAVLQTCCRVLQVCNSIFRLRVLHMIRKGARVRSNLLPFHDLLSEEPQNSLTNKALTYSEISMAKILGEPGDTSLKFSSDKGFDEFKQKFSLTNSEVAAFLRDLAQEIEAGGDVEVAYGDVSISVNPMPPIKLEVELEKDELEIEIKLKARS